MDIPGIEDIPPLTMSVLGLEVLSEVISITPIQNDAIAIHVRSSCKSLSWGTRSRLNSMTVYLSNPNFDILAALEKFRRKMAEGLARLERGLAPPQHKFLGVRVSSPGGEKGMNCIADADLTIGPTRLQREMVEALGLPRTGRFFVECSVDGKSVSIPLFLALITYDQISLEVEVLPTEISLPCVIGGEFVQRAVGLNYDLVYDLLDRQHWRALRNVARSKKKTVLIIGKYGENTQQLRDIQNVLRGSGYDGVLLQDFPDIEEQSLPEKLVLFASISRFVVCDDSSASGHIDELRICKNITFTTAILRPGGMGATAMQADLADNCDYMKVFPYAQAELLGCVQNAITWAEEKVRGRSAKLNQTYAWRNADKILN